MKKLIQLESPCDERILTVLRGRYLSIMRFNWCHLVNEFIQLESSCERSTVRPPQTWTKRERLDKALALWRGRYQSIMRFNWSYLVNEFRINDRHSKLYDDLDVARTMVYLNKKPQQLQATSGKARDYINNAKDRSDLHNALVEFRIGRIASPRACHDALIREVGKKHGVPYSTMYQYAKRAAEKDTADPQIIVKKRGRPSIINENDIYPIVQKYAEQSSYCPAAVRDELLIIHAHLTKDQVMHYVKKTFRKLVENYQREKIWGKSENNVGRGMGEGDGSSLDHERPADWGGPGCWQIKGNTI